MKFFHLFSNGEDAADFVLDEKDCTATVNRIAIVAHRTGVVIVAYDVESTHLHVLIYAIEEKADAFRFELQRDTRLYITLTRGTNVGAVFNLSMYRIDDEKYLHTAATYVICQATKEGRRIMPYDYRWCTAPLYFRSGINDRLWRVGADGTDRPVIKMKDISCRNRRDLFRTRDTNIPEDWEVCEGMILPSSFVDIQMFENIFRTHNAFRVFMASSRDGDRVVISKMADTRGVSLEEDEARKVCASLCKQIFGKSNPRLLKTGERIHLAQEMRKRYNVGYSQLARRVCLPESEIRKYIK